MDANSPEQSIAEALACSQCRAEAKYKHREHPELSEQTWTVALHATWSTHASPAQMLAYALSIARYNGHHGRADVDEFVAAVREVEERDAALVAGPDGEPAPVSEERATRQAMRLVKQVRDDLQELADALSERLRPD